jgi:CheY-like chemotaxis protein
MSDTGCGTAPSGLLAARVNPPPDDLCLIVPGPAAGHALAVPSSSVLIPEGPPLAGLDGGPTQGLLQGHPGVTERDHWVLVVDDDEATRGFVVIVLNDEPGLKARAANGGEAALTMCEALLPDAVLLDLMMPGMDGFELVGRLRAVRGLEKIPVVAMTAMGSFERPHERARAAGCDEVVNKPFVLDVLVAAVWRSLGAER